MSGATTRTIREPARDTRVYDEVDVLVVGGGPGGHSAAVAAARTGARTMLVERYGHLGGMPTGGLVTMMHAMSDGTSNILIRGIAQEWIDRLEARQAVMHPRKEDIGTTDLKAMGQWTNRFFCVEGHLIYGARFDAEILKCILNDMAVEAGVMLLLHSWGVQVIQDNGTVKGVVFESKSGRQAVLANVVIDGTGDGDLLPWVGEEFDCRSNPGLRINKPALTFEFANVNMDKAYEFKDTQPAKHGALMEELMKLGGFLSFGKTTREGVAHFNMFLAGLDVLNVDDLTKIEVDVRKRMLITFDFFKQHVPGFENCFIMVTAPQIGTRGSRRLVGEYVLTVEDTRAGKTFEDAIAVFPALDGVWPKHPHFHVPYRVLLPRKTEGLLVTGRSFGSDDVTNEHYNTISHCIALGQAAGTAAALAVKTGARLRDVNHRLLQKKLAAQGVQLPGVTKEGPMTIDSGKFKEVEIEQKDHVLAMTVVRPFTYTVIGELKEIWQALPEENDIRAVIIAGSGSDFSLPLGNAQLHPVVKDHPLKNFELAGRSIHGGAAYHMSVLKLLLEVPQPIVAAVHGKCAGLATTIVLHSDVIYAADNAMISDPHIQSGMVPGDGGAVIWPLLIGPDRAKEYLMTGDALSAAEAERIGLVNHVVPSDQLKDAAWAMARRLASGPPLAIRFTKHAINRVIGHQMELVWELADALQILSVMTDDKIEAQKAKAEGRKPHFTGR